jgi:hypothetical protein
MDLLGALGVLSRVAETGSFSAVARERRLSQSAVTRQISQRLSVTTRADNPGISVTAQPGAADACGDGISCFRGTVSFRRCLPLGQRW